MKILRFSKKFNKSFSSLDPLTKTRTIKILEKFQNDESIDMIKIKGTKDSFRIRIGNYRIRLEKEDKEWLIVDILLRKDAYKK